MGTITILGAGAMGTALTTPLARNGQEVCLWGTELDVTLLAELRIQRPHPRLGVPVAPQVRLYDPDDLQAALNGADVVVLAITSDGVITILQRATPYLRPHQPVMMVTKGFGRASDGRLSLLPPLLTAALPATLRTTCPVVAVGGPCKANEVAAGWPTATVYGCNDMTALARCQRLFQTDRYRILTADDVIGLELAAALKNAYAIALGICDGLEQASGHPWHNLKAAIFPQAVAEMARLAETLGGHSETVRGLAGVGDLEVTALSGRNRLLGERIGRGEPVTEALAAMRRAEQTVEGVAAAYSGAELLAQLAADGQIAGTDYPLLGAIHAILDGASNLVESLADAVLPHLGAPP
jgi:glycerol-3-phosphate dehydrogenase (NAD(P)+)